MPACEQGGFEFQQRIRVLERPEYLFEIDEYLDAAGHQFLYAHLRVFKFTPSVFKAIKKDWSVFRQHIVSPLFAIGEVEDAKWVKFVTSLGFVPAMDVVCLNGERRLMYRHARLNNLQPKPTDHPEHCH